MRDKLCIVVCDNLKLEVDAVLKTAGWNDVIIAAFHTDCLRPVADCKALSTTLKQARTKAAELHLIAGPCLNDSVIEAIEGCHFHKLGQCFELFAGKTVIDEYIKHGAYLLTRGWLAHWRSHLSREGFSQNTAQEFFRETAKKLVLLDSGIADTRSNDLREFAEFVNMPFEIVPVGTDFLQMYLAKLVLECRLRKEIARTHSALATADQRNADYATALDFVGSLTQATSEKEAIEKMIDLFSALFRPGHLKYIPTSTDGAQLASEPGMQPIEFSGDWSWTDSRNGFSLRISHQNESLGILEVADFQLPEYKEHYLNLSLELKRVCGLSIASARNYQRLEEAMAQLQAANKELEAFSYSVSHDLRAPLRSMDGFSHLLLEDYGDKLDAEGKEYLNIIKKSSQLMAQLIDDMLRLSRIGRAEMTLDCVNLSELAKSILDELQRTQPERQVQSVISPDVIARGDQALLKILMQNLLGNAWKYSSKVANARIELGVIQRDGEKAYFIKDNGIGFDMAYAGKLFQPFQRLHSDADYPGTGIGLAIAQRIVNRHGGRVWAEGKVGEGAIVYFTLD